MEDLKPIINIDDTLPGLHSGYGYGYGWGTPIIPEDIEEEIINHFPEDPTYNPKWVFGYGLGCTVGCRQDVDGINDGTKGHEGMCNDDVDEEYRWICCEYSGLSGNAKSGDCWSNGVGEVI